MAAPRIYKCCICHKILTDVKPIRLVKQKYPTRDERKCKQYYPVASYDFCEKCYKPIDKFINKYKEED